MRRRRLVVRCLWMILALAAVGAVAAYPAWSPGEEISDGRHDRHSNGLWMQHGWIGADSWFLRNRRDPVRFRTSEVLQAISRRLSSSHVRYAFVHLAPTDPTGRIPAVDDEQTEAFLDAMGDVRVLPWIGGRQGAHCTLAAPTWRTGFVDSVASLLARHPRLAGVHVNIEPMRSGDPDFLRLLEELRAGIPSDRMISVAAYPPPTLWHPFPDLHWDQGYFAEVAARCDQVVVMMYDTALRSSKLYRRLMANWTVEVVRWARTTRVLLGLPAYDDAGVGYHDPEVENLLNGLAEIHQGLAELEPVPGTYGGISIYSEWEMDDAEWHCISGD